MRPIKAIDGYEPFDENFTANRFDYQYSAHRNFMLWRLKLLDEVVLYWNGLCDRKGKFSFDEVGNILIPQSRRI